MPEGIQVAIHFVDDFLSSHHLFSWQCISNVRRNLVWMIMWPLLDGQYDPSVEGIPFLKWQGESYNVHSGQFGSHWAIVALEQNIIQITLTYYAEKIFLVKSNQKLQITDSLPTVRGLLASRYSERTNVGSLSPNSQPTVDRQSVNKQPTLGWQMTDEMSWKLFFTFMIFTAFEFM